MKQPRFAKASPIFGWAAVGLGTLSPAGAQLLVFLKERLEIQAKLEQFMPLETQTGSPQPISSFAKGPSPLEARC